MPTREGDAHVRLTNQAYALLTEKTEDYNVSQKEIASEAIILLIKRDKAIKQANLTIRRLKERERETAIAGTILGIAFSVVIGFIFGVV